MVGSPEAPVQLMSIYTPPSVKFMDIL